MTLLRSPALHFALIGLAAFLVFGERGAATSGDADELEIPWGRVERMHRQLERENGRELTEQEKQDANQLLVDREVLYLYSQDIGLQNDPVVQQRLGQISKFVAESGSERITQQGAEESIEFGLLKGDPVTRRIMVDGARRLIRATALVREPDDDGMRRYLEANQADYQVPRQTRIAHVTLNRSIRGEKTRSAAQSMLERLREEEAGPEEASDYSDPTIVPAELPLLTDAGLARRFGPEFILKLVDVPVGSWEGPVPSRLGEHVVYVVERIPSRTATLEEVRDKVSAAMRNALADKVLRARLDELTEHYGVRIQEPPS